MYSVDHPLKCADRWQALAARYGALNATTRADGEGPRESTPAPSVDGDVLMGFRAMIDNTWGRNFAIAVRDRFVLVERSNHWESSQPAQRHQTVNDAKKIWRAAMMEHPVEKPEYHALFLNFKLSSRAKLLRPKSLARQNLAPRSVRRIRETGIDICL
jgi:hypothetical protein